MRIKTINVYQVSLIFNGRFPHSRSEGGYADNVICEVIEDGGAIKGYGECAPRLYATGETPKSMFADISDFSRIKDFPRRLEDVFQIKNFIDAIGDGNAHNAAVCAL